MERIFRFIFCLIMVCSVLINCSPIRAEATGAGLAATWAAFAVAPEIAISAAMIALGVTVVAGSAAVLGGVVSECEQFLVENGYISGDLVDVYRADADSRIQYMISRELVEVIRDWLFDSGTVSSKNVISAADITCLTVSSSNTITVLSNDNPQNLLALIKGLGIGGKVFVYSQSASSLYGLYFNASGRLCVGRFINPLGVVHASLFGTFDYGALTIDDSYSVDDTVQCYQPSSIIGGYWSGKYTYYSIDHALADPSVLASEVLAFDWEKAPSGNNFYLYLKSASDVVFSSNSSTYGYFSLESGGYGVGTFEWGTTIQSVVSTDLDLNVSGVASPDKSFSDGYSEWASGAKSLPTLRNGEISDAESMYLSLGMADTLEDAMAMTQSQAQGGTITGSGTTSDTVTATGLKGWLDTLRMTLVDGFSDLKAGWAELTASLAGEKTEASTQGNQSVDQIIEIIPDDSQDYLAAFGSLVSVLSYEGTSAVIKMPALTVPALNGLFSEFTYLDEQEIDLEAYVNMLPEVVLTLIRALFDAALVLFCLKELFGVIEGVVNNFSDAREVIYE